jgi:hypothetical protein
MGDKMEKYLKTICEAISFGVLITVTYTYLTMAITGKNVMIITNEYGEHIPELILCIIGTILFIATIRDKIDNYIYEDDKE